MPRFQDLDLLHWLNPRRVLTAPYSLKLDVERWTFPLEIQLRKNLEPLVKATLFTNKAHGNRSGRPTSAIQFFSSNSIFVARIVVPAMICFSRMNPEKLFDYLEGNLSEQERDDIERRLATDPQLQRELSIAREMHRRSRGSREVIGESDDIDIPSASSSRLGRWVVTGFVLLVLINVLVGIAFIIGKSNSDKPARDREQAIRQQLSESVQRAAETAMPLPTLPASEILLTVRPHERVATADNVLLIASQCAGSAMKAPPDKEGLTVLAEIPVEREQEFRHALAPLSLTDFPSATPRSETPAAGERSTIYIRITETKPAATP